MHQKEPAVLNLEGQRCGDVLCPLLVVVASHHKERGDFLQSLNKGGGKKAPNSNFRNSLWSRGPKDAQGSTRVRDVLSAATRRWSRGPKDVRYPPSVRDALAGRPAARIVSGGSLPNSRKPCHPEHSVSDFGFHDCRWQSYLRKMRSSFDSLSLLRMTAFLKCLY